MNILIMTEIYDSGGIDTFIINLINNWPNDTDTFTLIANNNYPGLKNIKKRSLRKLSYLHYNAEEITNSSSGNTFSKIYKYFCYPLFLLKDIFLFLILFKDIKYNRILVINGGYPGGNKCRAASIASKIINPKAFNVHNIHNLALKKNFISFIQESIIDFFLTCAVDRFVTVSKSAALSFSTSSRLYNSKVSYIYNGVDNKKITNKKNIKLLKQMGINKNDKLCLMLATYEKRKGHDFLLNAFLEVSKQIPNSKLLISGFGSKEEKKYIRSLISSLKLSKSVFLTDFQEDIDTLIHRSSVVILPSQKLESFGYVLIEAMLRKKPTIGTNIGGIPEVIKNNSTGYIVDKSDVSMLSKKIITILSDPKIAYIFGIEGNKLYLKNFTAKKMSENYYKLLK